jgi:hypothetical protein
LGGVAVLVAIGTGVAEGAGDAVGETIGDAVGDGVLVGRGVRVGEAVGVKVAGAVAVAVGRGVLACVATGGVAGAPHATSNATRISAPRIRLIASAFISSRQRAPLKQRAIITKPLRGLGRMLLSLRRGFVILARR